MGKKDKYSVQELLGVKTFSEYGLVTTKGELVFYLVAPINISVLSPTAIETRVRRLMYVLTALPDIEIVCTDSAQCFEENKAYLVGRIAEENNVKIKQLLQKDVTFLNEVQMEMATARQFLFVARFRGLKQTQVFERSNMVQKLITEQGFDCHRLKKEEIKRLVALYFDASVTGEQLPDYDGSQYYQVDRLSAKGDGGNG